MGLESQFNFIDDLNDTNPNNSPDQVKEAAAHMRGIKQAVQGSFPNLGSLAVTLTAAELNGILAAQVPVGGISMFSGVLANLPANWKLCDGTNGTIDLRDKFVMGASIQADIGVTGGSADAAVVSHNHTANHNHPSANTNSTGAHTHSFGADNNSGNNANIFGSSTTHGANYDVAGFTSSSAGAHTHTVDIPNLNVTTSTTGSAATGLNNPAFYTLAYIQRLT